MDEWRVTLDEDDENAPEVGLPAEDYAQWLTYEGLPWWLTAEDWDPKAAHRRTH